MSLGLSSINVSLVTGVEMFSCNQNDQIMLRKLSSDDLDAFMSWASDDEVTKSLMWDTYKNPGEALAFLTNVVEKHPWFKAICLEKQVIGSITLERGKGAHGCKAELGYVIAKSFWSKGYATRAIQEVLKTGFTDLNLKRIEAFVDPENIASIRALEKAGFNCEGRLKNYLIHKGSVRDRLLYACTRP